MSKRCPNIDSRICANCSYRDTCNVQSGEQLVSWGNVSGDINKQTDLRNMMDELRTAIRQEVLSMKQEALLDNRDRISKLQSIWEKRFDDGFAGMLDRIDRAKEDTRLSLLSSLPKFRWNGTRLFLANDGVSYDDGIELKGEQGRAAFTSIVFKAGNDNGLIVAPTGGTFDSPVPAGWSDGIPERTANNPTIYMSKRKFTSDGVGQDSEWSTPVVAYDSQYTDICFHPATQSGATPQAPTRHGSQGDVISTWHDTGNSDDVWMAISYRDMRSNGWSDWSISKIKGENGEKGDPGKEGQSIIVSTIFKASQNKPAIPTGGTFDSPVPAGWSDGIPDVSSMRTSIWMSRRKFTSNGENQDKGWSEPVVACDTVNFDICFHKATDTGNPPDPPQQRGAQNDPNGWHDKGTSEDVWMATCSSGMRDTNPVWSITKIKGEKGDEGDTPIPSMDDDGILSWKWKINTDLSELPTKMNLLGPTMVPSVDKSTGEMIWSKIKNPSNIPSSVNIKGPKGDAGAQGAAGSDGLSVEYIGKFKTGVKYLVGDCVTLSNTHENNEYVCNVEHTSSASEIVDYSATQDGSGNRLSTTYWTLKRANTGSRRRVIDNIIDNYQIEQIS